MSILVVFLHVQISSLLLADTCSDKFSACSAAMSYFCNKIGVSVCIEAMFSGIIGYNPYCNMDLKESSLLYGLSDEDYTSMERICEGGEEDSAEMMSTGKSTGKGKKSAKKASFIGRFKWVIAGGCTAIVVGVAVYIFVM